MQNINKVAVYDPAEKAEKNLHDYILGAWPVLKSLGRAASEEPGPVLFHHNAADAVEGADFVQESVPENLDLKHALYAEVEPRLKDEAIVASSASGLMVSEMQKGWCDPSRFLLDHPFNPPHLIPLVELISNEHTRPGVLETAETFYENTGKVTIRVKREVPGHVANRLQAALWREAIHLVDSGVASVEDVDKAVWCGPGPACAGRRWDPTCFFISEPAPAAWKSSAIAIAPASTDGGKISGKSS